MSEKIELVFNIVGVLVVIQFLATIQNFIVEGFRLRGDIVPLGHSKDLASNINYQSRSSFNSFVRRSKYSRQLMKLKASIDNIPQKIIKSHWKFNDKSLFEPGCLQEIYTMPAVPNDWNTTGKLAIHILNLNTGALKLPLISVNVTKSSDELYNCMKASPYDEAKPLYYLVKTLGGGKSRLLCEIWKDLISKPDVLPIFVEFQRRAYWQGGGVSIYSISDTALTKYWTSDDELALMMSVAGRMIYSLVGGSFSKVFSSFVKYSLGINGADYYGDDWNTLCNLSPTERRNIFADKIPKKTFFRDFCGDLIAIVNHHRPLDRQVKGISLLIDTSQSMLETLYHVKDPYHDVRCGLLNDYFDDAHTLSGSLAMVGRILPGIDRNNTERNISILESPDHMDIDELVSKWFNFLDWNDEQMYTFRLCLSCVNGHPRLLQNLLQMLRRNYQDTNSFAKTLSNSSSFGADLFDKLFEMYRDLPDELLSVADMHNIIFNNPISIDENNVHKLVANGILTSSLERSKSVVPSASLVALRNYAEYASFGLRHTAEEALANKQAKSIIKVFEKMCTLLNKPFPLQSDLLETLFDELLYMKLYTFLSSKINVTLLELTDQKGISSHSSMLSSPIHVNEYLSTCKCLMSDLSDPFCLVPLGWSYSDAKEFKKRINGLNMKVSSKKDSFWKLICTVCNNTKNPVILSSKPNDHFDILMKYWTNDSEDPYYWFVDLRSGRALNSSDTNSSAFNVNRYYRRPLHILQSRKRYAPMEIAEDHVHYTFVSSSVDTSGLDSLQQNLVKNNCSSSSVSVMNREAVLNFLGPFGALYKSMKSTI